MSKDKAQGEAVSDSAWGKNSWGRSTLEREPHTCHGVYDKEETKTEAPPVSLIQH